MRALEWLIYLEHDPEPKDLMVHTWPSIFSDHRESGKGLKLAGPSWGLMASTAPAIGLRPSGTFISKNPPFESSARNWYQLRQPNEKPPYQLSEYTLEGRLLKEREAGFGVQASMQYAQRMRLQSC